MKQSHQGIVDLPVTVHVRKFGVKFTLCVVVTSTYEWCSFRYETVTVFNFVMTRCFFWYTCTISIYNFDYTSLWSTIGSGSFQCTIVVDSNDNL